MVLSEIYSLLSPMDADIMEQNNSDLMDERKLAAFPSGIDCFSERQNPSLKC